jgi:2-keto-4-pentenoate hydratase/2-oxohepta-3-ene-1,7-dioic acid hydratase in catechol pathway
MDRICRIEQKGRQEYVLGNDDDTGWSRLVGDPFGDYTTGSAVENEGVRLLAPVQPSKIVAVGLNYRDHAREMNKPLPDEPLIFLKPSTTVIGPNDPIVMPPQAERVDYEAELGIVIRKRAKGVSAAEAAQYILGLTCVNDVTARDLQTRDVQYTRAKGFDTFAPIGPCIVVGLDGSALDVESLVNGERRQASNTRELIFGLHHLVEFISSVMTLLPGDVISTGTPSGVGPVAPGDRVVVRVEGIGELVNEVIGDASMRGGLTS